MVFVRYGIAQISQVRAKTVEQIALLSLVSVGSLKYRR